MEKSGEDLLQQVVSKFFNTLNPRADDFARVFVALRELSADETRALLQLISGDAYTVVPTTPPAHWNPLKQRAYRLLIAQADLGPSSPAN